MRISLNLNGETKTAEVDADTRLIDMLRLRGFNEEEIEGIAGKNFLDYFRRIDG